MTVDTQDNALAQIGPRFVDRKGAEALTGISARHFENLSRSGKGPREFKVGRRVLLAVDELEAWVRRHARQSTSEDVAA